MNVSLTPELEKFVKDKVATGRYTSSSEVVREALRDYQEREEYVEYLKKEVQKGIDQADRGELVPGEEVFKRLKERNKSLRSQMR